ncbi:unnamed protein product [Rhizophagus irregularis]|nr:unnamed protein product [Rhizophagus irregularis]CAB5359736.1 unnamed protein product [Rhizophagus irregularis]
MEYRDGLTYHSIILRYRDDLFTRASGESQNNDETYIYRSNKSLISPESLLDSFIEEEYIVFLARVHDFEIKNAVLKIEVLKDSKISQIYREILALHALGDLSCVPTILFEEKIHARGYTHGDVAIRNVLQRNAIIRDYIGLCQIIGVIKFGKELSLLESIDKLDGELKPFVAIIENASRWKIINE